MVSSKQISDFLAFFKEAHETLNISRVDEQEANDEAQDLLHLLELKDDLTYHQTADLAKKLKDNRKKRRIAKNRVWICEPIEAWQVQNAAIIRSLEKLLGEVRKIEELQKNRAYIPKHKDPDPKINEMLSKL